MLVQAIGDVLPSAVGVALSPLPIIAVILMLGTPRARSNGPAFALGWVAGLVVVTVIVLAVTTDAEDPDSAVATGVDWTQVVFGLLFLVMAVRQWRTRPEAGESAPMPKWMATIDGFTAGRSLVLGAVLSGVNPKNLALTAAAAATIAQAGLSGGDTAVAAAVLVVVGSLTVAGPVLFFVIAGDKATTPLADVKEFMAQNNAVIMVVILVILGAKLLGQGLGGLAN
jgi:threonine/homoserine/homoserine lactone efflux protein